MHIIPLHRASSEEIANELRNGATIVYPTETCYGLGCDARNKEAVEKIFALKGRSKEKSLILILSDLSMIERYVEVTDALSDFAERYWPGAVTVVVPTKKNAGLPSGVINEDGTVAFRVSASPFARGLSAALNGPLVSTSANLAGEENPYTTENVLRVMKPDILIAAGPLPRRPPTTVVRLDGQKMTVLRQGESIVTG